MSARGGSQGQTMELLDEADLGPPMRLKEALSVRELSSESGMVFEIADEPDENRHAQPQKPFYDDAALISSLSLDGGMYEDDESIVSDGDESEPFQRLAAKMVDVSGDGGVLKMEVKPGVGHCIPDGASVTFHYSAFLEYSDEPFDSTMLREQPERKLLDAGEMIPGLNVAIKTMRRGEKSRFLIQPQYAFGEVGCPPRIPGGERLLYEVHVESVVDRTAADTFEELEEGKQSLTTFKERLEAAQAHHSQGNQHHSEGNLGAAKSSYYRATWIMEYSALKNREEELERGKILIRLRSNLAQIYLELKDPARACTQCKMGLAVTGEHPSAIIAKLYFRYGKAKRLLNNFAEAKKFLLKAKKIKPGWNEITQELEALTQSEEKWAARERFMCQRMFNFSDSSPGPESSSHSTPPSRLMRRPRNKAGSQDKEVKHKSRAC